MKILQIIGDKFDRLVFSPPCWFRQAHLCVCVCVLPVSCVISFGRWSLSNIHFPLFVGEQLPTSPLLHLKVFLRWRALYKSAPGSRTHMNTGITEWMDVSSVTAWTQTYRHMHTYWRGRGGANLHSTLVIRHMINLSLQTCMRVYKDPSGPRFTHCCIVYVHVPWYFF